MPTHNLLLNGRLIPAHQFLQLCARKHVAVKHVYDLQFPAVQLVRARGAAVLDYHHLKALVRQAADRGGDALVGVDAGHN